MKDTFIEEIRQTIQRHQLVQPYERIVVGFSGGIDSTGLLLVLQALSKDLRFEVFPIYVDHGLRQSVNRDKQVCQATCYALGLKLEIVSVDVKKFAGANRLSEEDAARRLRYKAFHDYRIQIKGDSLAVAHHLDDQVETMLHRYFRGSGISGLIGIPEHGISIEGDRLIRPFLHVEKKAIQEFLLHFHIQCAFDETNESVEYTRNKLRILLIPKIKQLLNPNLSNTLETMRQVLSDEDDYIQDEMRKAFDKAILETSKESIRLSESVLLGLHPALQRRICRQAIEKISGSMKDISFRVIEQILSLADCQSGKRIEVSKDIEVLKEYETWIFSLKKDEKSESGLFYRLDTIPYKGYIQNAKVSAFIEESNKDNYKDSFKKEQNIYTNRFDYDKIEGALVLRNRKPGDRIHINRDGQSKTLKKFLIDEKIPITIRDNLLLLAVGQQILWIIGGRANPFFEVTSTTRSVIRVEITKEENDGNINGCSDFRRTD